MPSVGSFLPLEDVLCGLCELLLPLNGLFNGQLGREGEWGLDQVRA